VIFFHGLTGSKETWLNASTNFYWPEQLATDPDVGQLIDVYRVDYDSYLLSPSPGAVDVLGELNPKLDALIKLHRYPRVIFVAHSLGGDIARTYLLHVVGRYGHGSLARFRLVYTFGSPFAGSPQAYFGKLSLNQQTRVLLPLKTNDYLQFTNLMMRDVDAKHRDYCPSLRFLAGYETKELMGAGIIVTQESATLGSNESRAFDADHVSMVKPSKRADPAYAWVRDGINTCVKGSMPCLNEPPIRGPGCNDTAADGFPLNQN
jgi:hypothetical protein